MPSKTPAILPLLPRFSRPHSLEPISEVKENLKAYCLGWVWKRSRVWTVVIVQGLRKSWMWAACTVCDWHFLSFGVLSFTVLSDYKLPALQRSRGLSTVPSQKMLGETECQNQLGILAKAIGSRWRSPEPVSALRHHTQILLICFWLLSSERASQDATQVWLWLNILALASQMQVTGVCPQLSWCLLLLVFN